MSLNGESKLAYLDGDPSTFANTMVTQTMGMDARMQAGPVPIMDYSGGDQSTYDIPGVAPDDTGTATGEVDLNDPELMACEQALITVLSYNTDKAIGYSMRRNQRWMMFQQMSQACPPYQDDPNDPLINLGYYVPQLAKLDETMGALILNTLFQDPSKYDFFRLDAKPEWQGIGMLSEALTAQLQNKFRIMRPEANSGFLGVFDLMLRDFRKFGNMLGLITHEILSDPMQAVTMDDIIMGPSVQKVDPFNAKPWRTDVENATDTPWSLYDPMTPDQAHQMGFENEAGLFENEQPKDIRNRYMEFYTDSYQNYDLYTEWTAPTTQQYERWVYLGKFPYYLMRQQMGESNEKEVQFDMDFQAMMGKLAGKFQFDPMGATPDTWFEIHYVGNTIIRCKPYGINLPVGMGPIIHHKLYPVSGYLWGEGIWDRCQWDERFFNDLQRAVIHIVKFTAKGVYAVREDMIKREWLQLHGPQLRFQPDDVIELDTQPGDNRKFFEKVEINEAAIPFIREQQKQLVDQMQADTGMYPDMQGQSRAKTLGQTQINVQAGNNLVDWIIKLIENGLLREIVSRMYVVMEQAANELGHVGSVSVSAEDGLMQSVMLQPADIISLNFVDITMTGAASPANRANTIASVNQIAQMFLPTGAIDIQKTVKTLCKLAQVPPDEIMFKPDMQDVMSMIQNLQTVAGPNWMQFVPQSIQQQMGMMLGPGPAAPPPGAPGAGAKGPQPAGGPQQQSPGGQLPPPQGAGPQGMSPSQPMQTPFQRAT